MIKIRRSEDRGKGEHGWLSARHSFSFGDYHDPEHHHFRTLRVINEDRVAPAQGFSPHPHRDMEIVTYIISGQLAHEDSMGNGETIHAGEVQRMSAGTGVIHSEFNASKTEPVHLLQIWIVPERKGIQPGYEQKKFDPAQRRNRLQWVATPDAREGSVRIHQDARIGLLDLGAGSGFEHSIDAGRHVWLQVIEGSLKVVDGSRTHELKSGDGLAVSEETRLSLRGDADSKLMLFDLG